MRGSDTGLVGPHVYGMSISQTTSLIRCFFAEHAFTTAEAQARGIGPDRLERAVHAGALRRLRGGLYALPGTEGADAWALAASRARQLGERNVPAVIAGSTSAAVWDVPIIGVQPDAMGLRPTLYVDAASGVREGFRDGVRIVHASLTPADVWESGVHPGSQGAARTLGAPSVPPLAHSPLVCMPLRSAIDLTRHLSLSEPAAVAALSAAQRRHAALLDGWVPPVGAHADAGHAAHRSTQGKTESRVTDRLQDQKLRDALEDELLGAVLRSPRRGLRFVHEALSFVDPRLETPLEAISWCHLCRSGLPLPLLQQWVTGASGRRYRVDFFWPDLKLIGEADGALKYRSAADVMAEKDRHADLGDAGHALVRWTWHDVWVTGIFLDRITREMDRARR